MDKYRSIYYANDRDIYDLIMSNRKKLPEHLLAELLREFNIIISVEDGRHEIANYISNLTHDFFMLQRLLDQTERGQRAEKSAFVVVETHLSSDELMESINKLKLSRESTYNEIYTPRIFSDSLAKIPVHYEEMDFGKTKLMQRREKQAEIQVEIQDGKVLIRGPASEKGGEIIRDFVKAIEETKDSAINQRKIELSGVTNPEARSKFFLNLIDNLDGYTTLDVTTIKIDKDIYQVSDEDEDDSDVQDVVIGQVKHALLNGDGLVHSPEFKRFTNSGFYISKIEWVAINKSGTGSKIIFEASLEYPVEGTGFKYTAKGFYKQKESGDFSSSRYSLKDEDKRYYLALLEKSAWKSLEMICS